MSFSIAQQLQEGHMHSFAFSTQKSGCDDRNVVTEKAQQA